MEEINITGKTVGNIQKMDSTHNLKVVHSIVGHLKLYRSGLSNRTF